MYENGANNDLNCGKPKKTLQYDSMIKLIITFEKIIP